MALSSDVLIAAYTAIVDKGWSRLTLTDVAAAAGLSLADLRQEISSKYDLIGALNRHVDALVLEDVGTVDTEDSPRERLFEVMMARFDALQPYKDALGVMALAARGDIKLASCTHSQLQTSMGWMLEAAALGDGGWRGSFRRNGLALVYVRASMAWLKDDSEDLSGTMKALDKALGDAERWANSVEGSGAFTDGFERARDRMREGFEDMAARARDFTPGGGRYRAQASEASEASVVETPVVETPDPTAASSTAKASKAKAAKAKTSKTPTPKKGSPSAKA